MGIKQVLQELKVVDGLVEACVSMNIETPTESQAKAIASILHGGNGMHYVGPQDNRLSPLTFIIPILHSLSLDKERTHFMACIICHDYAKSIEINDLIESLGSFFGVKCEVMPDYETFKVKELQNDSHILVASLQNLTKYCEKFGGMKFDHLVKFLVLQEPEKMIIKSIDGILKTFESRKDKITTFFLANKEFKTNKVKNLFQRFMREPFPKIQEVNPVTHDAIGSSWIDEAQIFKCIVNDNFKKVDHLIHIIETSQSKCVVFMDLCAKASRMMSSLNKALPDHKLFKVVTKMKKEQKAAMLKEFDEYPNHAAILVCSDGAIKGVRIPVVGMYISYGLIDPPEFDANRLARVEMTANAGLGRRIVQLVDKLDLEKFYCLVEHLLGELNHNIKTFKQKRADQLKRIADYEPSLELQPSSEELLAAKEQQKRKGKQEQQKGKGKQEQQKGKRKRGN